MVRRRVVSLLAGGLLALAAALVATSGAAMADGNNADVKIVDTVSGPVSDNANEPKVCEFYLHFVNADPGQYGEWHINTQPGGALKASGNYTSNASGEAKSDTIVLDDGHYKLYWSGDAPEKHKVFQVDCAATPTDTPTPTPTPTPTATPTQTLQGETSTPTATPTAFQTQAGETATAAGSLPPTSTSGSGPMGGSTPLFALLICLAFGGLGLTAVEAQRRTVRR